MTWVFLILNYSTMRNFSNFDHLKYLNQSNRWNFAKSKRFQMFLNRFFRFQFYSLNEKSNISFRRHSIKFDDDVNVHLIIRCFFCLKFIDFKFVRINIEIFRWIFVVFIIRIIFVKFDVFDKMYFSNSRIINFLLIILFIIDVYFFSKTIVEFET